MIERVIYCALTSMTMLDPVPHAILHRSADGVVVAIRDENVALSRQPSIALLFFSRDAYTQATQGLTDSEIDAVIRKRRQYWSPNASGQGLNWIFESAKQSLTRTAQASTSGADSARLKEHFEQSLQLLVTISGEARYEDLSLASLLVLVDEGEGKLHREYRDAQETAEQAGDSRAAQQFADAAQRTERYGRALGSTLSRLGRPEFDGDLPYAGLSRGVFIRPLDPEFVKSVAAQRQAYVTWKDGMVVNWSLDNLPELEKLGKSARVLYFNGGRFLTDLRDLTSAQYEREFAKRLEGGRGASLEARREHLNSLWLEQHLLRRKALAQARTADAGAAGVTARQVTEEAEALRQELAEHPAWLEDGEQSGKGGMEALKKDEDQMLEDARFLAALCKLERDADSEALFRKIANFKPAQP